ncbi:hypothetical protein [Amphritea pacifica]|uniref:DUF4870 domain-containing protein n=1 Tax=Amphritea pacifica TaxID=2811233 RepID=A0ABS2WBZ5_9GAMM|nr:hypothetical protein [Amphritea pacifica]MBN0989214.1 hypothetical protein [Amphritea pacifica]MBN1008555.1 hypothetical protein [Amphritea pacifica]
MRSIESTANRNRLAIVAESLYLINLLALPGIALVILCFLRWKYRHSSNPLERCHLHQACLISGWFCLIVIGGGTTLWVLLAGSAAGISMILLYLIVMHTGFVLLGIFALAKAISGQHFHPGRQRCPV